MDADLGSISFRTEANVASGTSGETASNSEVQNETTSSSVSYFDVIYYNAYYIQFIKSVLLSCV